MQNKLKSSYTKKVTEARTVTPLLQKIKKMKSYLEVCIYKFVILLKR